MCSDQILNAGSCYIDNFDKIIGILGMAIVMGIVIGFILSLVYFFIKKS